ncbi:MAG: hypothetical protein OBKJMPBA_00020 [Methanophagales virus PBV304]|uniref:DNA-directed DNA polymerase n=1 Tax=Methanophagales virus PBV304 TaxID=3071309 RepID=A0AA46YIQ0_9VIRU|nr:MAG: hypothetical protein QIT47_gp20 [Methanophagales virus PBV304]UYL65052.1 MAG: hypothetical protein OBKJMPBA_00020 [Methanophagales virus PBV304]
MSVPTTEPHIDLSKLRWRSRPLRDLTKTPKNHDIVGWDTETFRGYARIIANSTSQYLFIEKQKVSDEIFTQILRFLTSKKWRGTHGFFWNIDYDFFAIIKYAGEDFARELYENGEAEFGKWKISYIPKKAFSITENKHTYDFFDLYQFYNTSLEYASQKYLREGKLIDLVERERLNDDIKYWNEHFRKIVEYCIKDCELTAKLGVLLKDTLKYNIKFIPTKYISKAYISKEYFRRHTRIPTAPDFPKIVNELALLAYYGGRFEITQRGYIGKCSLIDINSSYPYAMTFLKSYPKDAWVITDDIKYEDTHGFYKIKVNTKDNAYITPFPFRFKERVIFPKGEFITYATKEEILAYEHDADIEIIGGVEARGEGEFFLKPVVEHLYEWKKKAKGNEMEYMLVKILLNSIYGAFYEKQKRGEIYLTGKLFSPPYATLITAIGRINLYKEAKRYGHRLVGMATDSILVYGKADTPTNKKLGGWSFEDEGDTYVLMSGIYKIGGKIRMRGIAVRKVGKIQTPHGEFNDIFDYIKAYPQLTQYKITHERPVKLGEVLTHTKLRKWEDLNVWIKAERTIDINGDVKREWHDLFANGEDFLSRTISSDPIDINELYEFVNSQQ